MSISRSISLAFVAVLIAACSATPSKPTMQAAPAAPTAPTAADISGNWILTVQAPTGAVEAKMIVVQTGTTIKGTLDSPMGLVDYTGSVNGNNVSFTYSVEKFGAPAGTVFTYDGSVKAGAMMGKAQFSTFGGGDWDARRP